MTEICSCLSEYCIIVPTYTFSYNCCSVYGVVGSWSEEAFEANQCAEALDVGQAWRGVCKYGCYSMLLFNCIICSSIDHFCCVYR